MAAALPAINPAGLRVSQSPSGNVGLPKTPESLSQNKPSTHRILLDNTKKRSQSKKDKELIERKMHLRALQPDLTKTQTAHYRSTYKHNLCVEMLRQGYHKSFTELFSLIHMQNQQRIQAGPDSLAWSLSRLENEVDKLDMLQKHLCEAEAAERREDFSTVYHSHFSLARYFQSTSLNDKWISDHFFNKCLDTAGAVKSDGGKSLAEGHCNVGLALEEANDISDATHHFELFYDLCKDQPDWELDTGKAMHQEACNHLSRIYTKMAASSNLQPEQVLSYLKKAYDMAKEGGDRRLAGEASYRLGVAHEKHGNASTALHYLTNYLETCRTLEDNDGIGKACEAIARAYEREGKIEESIKYLEMFVDISERSGNDQAISRACSCLGAMFNTLGRYDAAVENFNKAYHIGRQLQDKETISASRVLYGVASAHKMITNYNTHIQVATKPCIERLIEWKDNRGDEFDKPIPEPVQEAVSMVAEDTTTPATPAPASPPPTTQEEDAQGQGEEQATE